MDVKTFRDNLFSMNTRRFGIVAEHTIKRLTGAHSPTNIHHDLRDLDNLRIEVKFSRVEKKHKLRIEEYNVLNVIEHEGLAVRMFPFLDWKTEDFYSNIQQVKPSEFDVLFYGLLFADRVVIFYMIPEMLLNAGVKYCPVQHKGNVGEGQFKITPKTLQYHLDNHHLITLSYADLMKLLRNPLTVVGS